MYYYDVENRCNQLFDEKDVQKNSKSCNIINAFTVIFDQFNASLLDKSIVLSKKKIILASNL